MYSGVKSITRALSLCYGNSIVNQKLLATTVNLLLGNVFKAWDWACRRICASSRKDGYMGRVSKRYMQFIYNVYIHRLQCLRVVFFKMLHEKNFIGELSQCPQNKCPIVNVYVANGNMSDSDCSSRFRENQNYLQTATVW